MDLDISEYEDLAIAVIKQAVYDYKMNIRKGNTMEAKTIEKWFRKGNVFLDIFEIRSTNPYHGECGNYIIENIKKEVE